MPKFYTVATNNAFAALDEHDDGDDLILNQSAPTQVSALPQEPNSTNAKDARQQEQRKRGPRPPRPTEGSGRLQRVPSGEAQEPNDQESAKVQRAPRERKLRPEGRLDRQSGTGFGREVKKGGAGAYGWGQAGDEGVADTPAAEEGNERRENEGAAEASPEYKAPSAPQSFADYKAEQEKARLEGLNELPPTKSDTSAALGAGVRVYTKVVDDTANSRRREQSSNKTSAVTSPVLNFRYNNPRPPRSDNYRRDDRREPRDAEGTERKQSEPKPQLDDAQAFPTLMH